MTGIIRLSCIGIALLALPAPPATAFQADGQAGEVRAERCIGYRRDAGDRYRLVNNCDYSVQVAVCADDRSLGACQTAGQFAQAELAPRAEMTDDYPPLQAISLFACRAPARITFQTGGMGSCAGGGGVLPLLLASALKNPAAIITSGDYPRGVRAEGTTRFELVVGADGRAQSCAVTLSSGTQALDTATCEAFVKRARFTPAKDAAGRAVASRYRGSVTWKEP